MMVQSRNQEIQEKLESPRSKSLPTVEIRARRSRSGSGCIACYPKRLDSGGEWEVISQSSTPTDDEGSPVGIGASNTRRSSFSYHRLPDARLTLSVLKLDNTSFEVTIRMSATVAELKTAVENVFRGYSEEDGGNISWVHVWGNFCLCFEDYKLIDERAYIKDYGIKDGDQLRFMRHLQVKTNPTSNQRRFEPVKQNTVQLRGLSDVSELVEYNRLSDFSSGSSQDAQCTSSPFDDESKENTEIVPRTEFKLTQIFRSWLAYSKLLSPREREKPLKSGKYF